MAIEFEGFRNINIPAPKRTDYTAEELATFLKELESVLMISNVVCRIYFRANGARIQR